MQISKHNFLTMTWLEVCIAATAITDAFMLLFFTSIGLTLEQLGVLTIVGALMVFIFEVPSGMIADATSRKTTIVICTVCMLISSVLVLFGSTFFMMLLASIFLGAAWAFYSGSNQALLYDSFLQDKRKKEFEKALSQLYAYLLYVMAAVTIVGGFLYAINPRLIFVVSTIASLGMVICAMILIEPKRSQKIAVTLRDIQKTLQYISKKKVVVNLIIFAGMSYVVNGIYKYHPIFFGQIGFSTELIGFVFAGMFLYGGIISHNLPFIIKKIGRKTLLGISMFLYGLPYVLFGLHPVYFIGFFIFLESTAAGYFSSIERNILNQQIRSKDRATVLSITHFVQYVVISIVGALISFVSSTIQLTGVYLIVGTVAIIAGSFMFFKLRNQIDWKKLDKN